MKPDTPFIKDVAFLLALLMLRAPVCAGASLTPGTVAILGCSVQDHEMRTAWERSSREVSLDPFLLVLNEDKVSYVLEEWQDEGEALKAAWKMADRSTLERSRSLLDAAWSAYYSFTFEKAIGFLQEAEDLLAPPGDSRLRSRISFELSVLKGMVLKAVGDRGFGDEFKNAAAFSPETELPPEKYSPEIISAYSRVRDALVKEEKVAFTIEGSPADAEILLDGKNADIEGDGRQLRVLPGKHFVEARAPGYEPYTSIVDAGKWDSPALKFNLVQCGPEGEPDRFFLGRLKAGDRSYLSEFMVRLDVDYLLMPDWEDGTLRSWLVGRDGRTVAQGKIWEPGDHPDWAAENLTALLEPFRQDPAGINQVSLTQMNMPPLEGMSADASMEPERAASWKRYAAVLGVLIIAALIAGSEDSDGGGGTNVEVTW